MKFDLTEEQQLIQATVREFADSQIRPVASGHAHGCFALTEPQAGSDATNQATLAVREGDHYVIDGCKRFITTGREASFALVFCQTDRAQGHRGISAFVVEKGTPGFTVTKTEDKLGIRASDTAELVFDGCRVPAANRLGEEGQGFRIAAAMASSRSTRWSVPSATRRSRSSTRAPLRSRSS